MIIYKETEKLQAELFKNVGYFFGSIGGLLVIRIIVYGDNLFQYMNYQGCCAIICLWVSVLLIRMALAITKELDYKSSKQKLKETQGD